MKAIYKRELRSYFQTMTGYIFIGLMLAVIGLFTTFYNLKEQYPDFEIVLYGSNFIFLLMVPLLTMRSFADERRQKTDQLLYSLPIKVSRMVLGKYLAMLTVFAIPLALMCFYPLILSIYGTVNFGATYLAILAYFFLGAALIAIGMFMSTLTESQAIAAVLSFGALLAVYLMGDIADMISSSSAASAIAYAVLALVIALLAYFLTKSVAAALILGGLLEAVILVLFLVKRSSFESAFPAMLNKLSLFQRFVAFVNGIFDAGAVIYYITVACVFVVFAVQSLEKRRWS